MYSTYNLREFMNAVPGAEEAIITQVSDYELNTKYRHEVGEFTVPEGMLLDTENYKTNTYFDENKQITVGHKQYVIHEDGSVWAAISLAPHQFTTGDVLQGFMDHCKDNDMEMFIDSQEWEFRRYCEGKAGGYTMTVDSIRKEPKITPISDYPELIPEGLVLYPNGRTRTLQRVLKHIVRYDMYKIDDKHKEAMDAEDSGYAKSRFRHGTNIMVEKGTISILRDDGIVEEIEVNRLRQGLLRDLA